MSCCNHCRGADKIFNEKMASRDLKRYHKKGANKSTRLLLEVLRDIFPEGKTLLDIGGGIGVISFELFQAGIAESVHIDASSGYLDICRKEAEKRDLTERMNFIFGDFTELAEGLKPADIVTLDRVVCCYPDMVKLVESSAGKTLGYIGLVYPRVRMLTKIGLSLGNIWFRIRSVDFRTYLHHPEAIGEVIRSHGFKQIFSSHTMIWEVAVYKRQV